MTGMIKYLVTGQQLQTDAFNRGKRGKQKKASTSLQFLPVYADEVPAFTAHPEVFSIKREGREHLSPKRGVCGGGGRDKAVT